MCDRCSIWYNRVDLNFQFDWRGTSLQNLWILVCRKCLDIPQEQLRAIQLPADPDPIWQPRVENFQDAESNYLSTVPQTFDPVTGLPIPSTTLRVTQDCLNRITQPVGGPDGLDQPAVMPYNGGIQQPFGALLPILSLVANGTRTVSATCSAAHGLQTNSQISVNGVSKSGAAGFYSVTVISATAFSYQTAANIPAGSLLTSRTRVVTTLVGLPLGAQALTPA